MQRSLVISISVMLLWVSHGMGQQPNVLLIISDDLNTRIGPYMEITYHTPNLDQLAAEGVRFTRTYCQYPLCGPSRASLMSGLYCETNGILNNSHVIGSFRKVNPELAEHPSMAGFFREKGYYTARVSKIYHMGVPGGIERGEAGGDDPDSWDYAYNVMGPETLSEGTLELLSPGNLHYGSNFARMILDNELETTQADYLTVSQAIAIMENRTGNIPPNATNKQKTKPDAPFFLGVGLVRPHVPLIAPANCYEPYPDQEMQLPPVVIEENVPPQALVRRNMNIWKMDEEQQKKTISSYMASVRFMDQQVGRLLSTLDRLQIRDSTIVIFISDHGYNLGEHDCWSKTSLWEGTVRVPFIISYPQAPEQHGKTCNRITELIDLYPTLAELCGMKEMQPSILQGESLATYITKSVASDPDGVAYTTTRHGNAATIRTDRWRYTRWGQEIIPGNEDGPGNEELYDHHNDPEEFQNLAGRSDFEDTLQQMREKFEQASKKVRNGLLLTQQ